MKFFKEKIKRILKNILHWSKKYPMLYRVALYCNVVLNKIKRYIKHGNCVSWKISAERRVEEENFSFEKDVKFSILVPLYNTPKKFLEEMIFSVINQTYKNWELCLADGSDKKHTCVGEYCKTLAKKDSRIKYEKLQKNEGISENTNACIRMSTGNYTALFDHDDVLHPSALFECMKAICQENADYVYTDEAVFLGNNKANIISFHFKPDFSYDNLIANNYICHFSVFKTSLLEKAGHFRSDYDGSQDHDIILRLTNAAEKIVHIPKLLYFWRSHAKSVAMDINSKTYAINAGRTAVYDFLKSKGIEATVESSPAFPTIYRVTYKIEGEPKVSIIIPNKDNEKVLRRCVESICEKSTYNNYEIIIVDNQSTEESIFRYYEELKKNEKISVYNYDEPFNYSAINNFAATKATGDYLLLLDKDTEVIEPDWIEELLMFAQRGDVGAVGAKLLYPNDTVQHGGIVLGLGKHGIADCAHRALHKTSVGYMGRLFYAQNVSAVTAACMMVKKSDFISVGGFDEKLAVDFNDVDFCLKLRERGLENIFSPYSLLYRYESLNRENDIYNKTERLEGEIAYFKGKWNDVLEKGDPYYNPNFSLKSSYEYDFVK